MQNMPTVGPSVETLRPLLSPALQLTAWLLKIATQALNDIMKSLLDTLYLVPYSDSTSDSLLLMSARSD